MSKYSEEAVINIIRNTVSATIEGMKNWLESDHVVIRDKSSGEILKNTELDSSVGPFNYVYDELEKVGIIYERKKED